MSDKNTSLYVRESDLEALDAAAESIFGTDEVPRRVTLQQLIDDHDAVDAE